LGEEKPFKIKPRDDAGFFQEMIMRQIKIAVTLLVLAQLGCAGLSSPVSPTAEPELPTQTQPPPATETPSPEPSPTATSTPEPSATATASPEPSPTPTEALLDLEILEWGVFDYANLSDPSITDQRVEILLHNPNPVPVWIDRDNDRVELLNAAGETVYVNNAGFLYAWSGGWVRAGEVFAITLCACFETDGGEKEEWATPVYIAALEDATGIAYTEDVEFSLGEFFDLAEAHLGSGYGAEITMTNTSDLVLMQIEALGLAFGEDGAYVGVVVSGAFIDHDGAGGFVPLEPGGSGTGIIVNEIDYYDGPMTYTVTAIGIPAED
jgi:hypothetical protein